MAVNLCKSYTWNKQPEAYEVPQFLVWTISGIEDGTPMGISNNPNSLFCEINNFCSSTVFFTAHTTLQYS